MNPPARHLLLTLALLSAAWPMLPAQPINVDSIKRSIPGLVAENQQAQLIEAYKVLARHFTEQNEAADAVYWLKKGLETAEDAALADAQFYFLLRLGSLHYHPLEQYRAAIGYLTQAEVLSRTFLGPQQQAEAFLRLADIYAGVGDYVRAIEYQQKGLRIAEQQRDTAALRQGMHTLGILYWSFERFGDAQTAYKRALSLCGSGCEPSQRLNLMASIGGAALLGGLPDTAYLYTTRAAKLADDIGERYLQAYCRGMLGAVLDQQGRHQEALVALRQAMDSLRAQHLLSDQIGFTPDLVRVYVHLRRFPEADSALRSAFDAVRELESPLLIKDLMRARFELLEARQDPAAALQAYKAYIRYRDSLQTRDRLALLDNLDQSFEVLARDERIADLEAHSTRLQQRMYLYAGIGAALLIGVVIVAAYLRYRSLKRINQLLTEKNETIRLHNQRLESSNQDLRQFAHATSHDLREPLRTIGSFASLLKRRYYSELNEEGREFLDFITSGVDRMNTLLSDLLTYSMMGILEHRFEPVDLNEIITHILGQINKEKSVPGLKITLHNLPKLVADRNQMTQLFHQLIDNSIKFRSEAPPQIQIGLDGMQEGQYRIYVRDNGIGMDEAYTDKVFNLFLRLHDRSSGYNGTGIGLALARKIVEQHKGSIWIESKPGQGTTVWFTLPGTPLAGSPAEASPREAAAV